MDEQELIEILKSYEDRNLELKEAKLRFSKDDLFDYCAALANGEGGFLIIGVDNNKKIVGTSVYKGTENKLEHEIYQNIGMTVKFQEVYCQKLRVLVIKVPKHSIATPIRSKGHYTYPIRLGESLVEMDAVSLRNIFSELDTDYSREVVQGASVMDLDSGAIDVLRHLWSEKARREDFLGFSDEKLLRDLGLVSEKGVTVAALLLVGSENSLARFLPDAEIIFEWRQQPSKISYDFRQSWRKPFLDIFDEIWVAVNTRNLRMPVQAGFIQKDILAFDEKSIREALLNAFVHRDYTVRGKSIFIKASPEEFLITSPGGFLPGINITNILTESAWRNRLLAETLEKAGLVERSGQGVDDIFRITILDGKGLPVYSNRDAFAVQLKIPAKVKDDKFILYLSQVAKEKGINFDVEQVLELERVRTSPKVKDLKFKDKFLELGIVDKVGYGRGVSYILSYRYYAYTDKAGIFTKLKGIQRNKSKELILDHLRQNSHAHARQFFEALSELKKQDVSNLLQELRKEGKIKYSKATREWSLVV